ncbi:hypothetical protein GW17_00013543 [Ensete ventricosum]|nr:hypothetical protein GW17_00013543 [Ensete ventricosum]RZS27258.1 hypothetical protein BHM03_00060701 [Ensete ventricosum]
MEKGGERLVGRSHFSLTCRLLSQYLKKNGSYGGDLGLLLAPRPIDHEAKGQILIIHDKAKDLLLMASKGSVADPAADCTSNEPAVALQSSLPKPDQANSSSNYPSLTFLMLLHVVLMDPPSVTDMPIARRNSLNRFLEKRKDRLVLLPRNFSCASP